MKATFTDHLPSGKTVEYTSVPLPVWNTQGNAIASNQYVVDGTEIKRTGLHSDEGKLQDFIVNLMNVHFGGMVLDVPSECPIKKLYTSSDLKFLLDWYAAQLTKNSDEINALFIRVQELERKSFSSSDGYYYITPKDTSMISFVTGTNLVLSTIKNKFDVGGSDDDLVFTSKNPELFTVENGNLVKKGTGIGVLEAASKKNSSLKVAVKVLSIRPEDIGIEGVDGLQDGGIEGTTAPDTANLDTNTGGNFGQSVLTVSTVREHNNDADEIKKILTVTETYNVDNSNGTYRLNAQGKPEKTGDVGTGRLSKTVTVSYGTEQVKSVTVVTHVDVERSRRTLALKKPVVFIEGASLEYNVQDVLDVKYNGTSESLSGYTVKYGSPFRIEGNKLKYTGTFGDAATLTLVKDGTEVSTSVNTYRLPTFSTVEDITTSDHVRKKITVPNPTGPVMSLPGIVTDTTFVQSTSDIYVEATGNTADVFGMSAINGTLTITQTVYYNTTLLTQHVQTVNVTVTSDEVHATGITLNSTFPFRNGKIVMFNVADNDKLNNIPISSLATLTGPSNMTSKLKARLLGTNEGFAIEDGKLKLTANRKSVNRIQLYSSDDESIAKEVELLLYPLPVLSVRPTDISGRVGDAPQNINSGLQDAYQYNEIPGFSHDIKYSTTSNSFTVETPGVVRFVSAGAGTATVELDATLDGKIFYKTYANVNITVTSNEYNTGGESTPTPTLDPDRPVISTSSADRKIYVVGDAAKLVAREYPDATSYTWHLPDGSTRSGREIDFTATPQTAGLYQCNVTFSDPYKTHISNIRVNVASLQETAASGADKEIHVGESVDFNAPAAIGTVHTSQTATREVDEDEIEYQWQMTTTPEDEGSWKDIEGAEEQNLKYVASEPGVYYVRRTAQFGEATAVGGKTKVTVRVAEATSTPKRISSVTMNAHNYVNIIYGGTRTFNYTVNYTGEVEDSLTNNIYLVSPDNITASVDSNAKTITFNPGRDTGGKTLKLDIMSNGNKVGSVNVEVSIVTGSIADDHMFEIGEHIKLKVKEYPDAIYTWHLPDGSTREGKEIEFTLTPQTVGLYLVNASLPDPTYIIDQNITVEGFSIQETAVSEADKEIHVGDSIDFTAPPAVGMLYTSDGGTQVDDDNIEYSWQITTTPDVDSSWTAITGATDHNLKYVASEAGVYYIRRKATMGDGITYGGKTKVTVTAAESTPTPTPVDDSSTPTPTPKPVDDSTDKSASRPKRISNVTVNGLNLVKIQAGTPATVNYTVTYNGELEDGNTNNFNIVPSNAESSYTIGDNNSVTIDGIDITVDKTNKTIAFHTESNLGAKEVELEVLSNSNVVGMFTVNVTVQPTSTPTPTSPVLEEHGELVNTHSDDSVSTPSPTPSAGSGYEEHGVRVNPNDSSASTSTPTPTPKPVDDSLNKSTPRPVRDGNTPSPKPVDDGSTPTPTPTAGPVL